MEQAAITGMVGVAAGAFAPGHTGELTQIVPFEMVDEVLAETGAVNKLLASGYRCRENSERHRLELRQMEQGQISTPPDQWTMYVGGAAVGTLSRRGVDQPWILCGFEPLSGWSSQLRDPFEAQNEAARNKFPPDQMWSIKAIHDKGVELHGEPEAGEYRCTPLIAYVENGEARFRG
ncbi:hypothetical protein [Streptomyces xanthophaeus]|uniref:hypothetical protein n=1 Tax=Streptomyces xanthophaeus TaxID=67385 RepID=UPI00233ECEEB|nr:hypothetical protein [Streptomyces xanthophaeus]